MLNLKYEENKDGFKFESCGHAEHDVCVAVTALCSALQQYAIVKKAEGKIKFENSDAVYVSGYTKIKFKIVKCRAEIIGGLNAFLIAFQLYAQNFPEQIKLSAVGEETAKLLLQKNIR